MSEHYTDGRRWSYISQAWIFADGWNDREEIARLEAKVRELEEWIRVANAINHAFKQSEENLEATLHTQQDRIRELEERLKDRDEQADVREPLIVGQQERIKNLEAKLRQTEKECENALAALAGEPYPYPEVRRKK